MLDFNRLDQLIEDKGVSKSHLCRAIGKNRYYIRDAKTKGLCVSDDHIAVWSNILGTTVDYLTGKTDDPAPANGNDVDSELKKLLKGKKNIGTLIAYHDGEPQLIELTEEQMRIFQDIIKMHQEKDKNK